MDDELALRILTRAELVARLARCRLGEALEILAHDQLLKARLQEQDDARRLTSQAG